MPNFHYIVATNDEKVYKKYIGKHFENHKIEPVLVDNGMGTSMHMKYNVGLSMIKPKLKNDDIVVFVHEDVRICDKYFERMVEIVFEARPNIGLLGVYGVNQFERAGGWWMCDRHKHARGQILQGRPDLQNPFHMTEGHIGLYDDLVSVDGCIMMFRGNVARGLRFDEETYDGYHFYDCDTSFKVVRSGFDVAVADILVEHASEGPLSDSWEKNKNKFVEKWESIGLTFPATVEKLRKLPV